MKTSCSIESIDSIYQDILLKTAGSDGAEVRRDITDERNTHICSQPGGLSRSFVGCG